MNDRQIDAPAYQLVYDGWLDKYFTGTAGGLTVLELGCGWGRDTSFLSGTGHTVVACDIDGDKIEMIKEKYPGVITSKFDMREIFPFGTATADIVIASLCILFFNEAETLGILAEIRRVLKNGGKFLCRLISEKGRKPDVPGEAELSPGLFMTSGGLKQFYNEDRIRSVFKGWNIRSIMEYEMASDSWRMPVLEVVMD